MRPHLLSSGQSSWLQIQRSGFYSRRYHIYWEVVGLERGPLSIVNTTEELLERKSSGSGLEIREYGRRDPSRWPRDTLYRQKLALTSPTSGGQSVGIVRSRNQATEFSSVFIKQLSLFSCCSSLLLPDIPSTLFTQYGLSRNRISPACESTSIQDEAFYVGRPSTNKKILSRMDESKYSSIKSERNWILKRKVTAFKQRNKRAVKGDYKRISSRRQ
jgi:hypothetical protein